MNYLAAALEQEEPEDKELRINLDLKEPLWGPDGENPEGGAFKTVTPGEIQTTGSDGGPRETGKSAVSGDLSRDGVAGKVVETLIGRRTSNKIHPIPPARSARERNPIPLKSARAGIGVDLDSPLGRRGQDLPIPLVTTLRRARTGADFVRRERRNLSITLPETPVVAGSLSAEELDGVVERDARRYDGGCELY